MKVSYEKEFGNIFNTFESTEQKFWFGFWFEVCVFVCLCTYV